MIQERRLRIIGVPGDDGACAWFRIKQPLAALEKAGLAEVFIPPYDNIRRTRTVHVYPKARESDITGDPCLVNNYDIVVLQRQPGLDALKLIEMSKRAGVFTVFDIDDGAFSIDPTNPNYMAWGRDKRRIKQMAEGFYRVQRKQGGPLPPGLEGKTAEEVANTAKGHRVGIFNNIRAADMVTVTTQALRDEYSALSNNIKVLPNQMNLEGWDNLKVTKHPDEVWIGWAGGWSHAKDLRVVTRPMQEIMRRHAHVKFVIIGFVEAKHLVFKTLPEDRVISIPWNPDITGYRKDLASLDIVLAPSYPSKFNEGKSDIRCMEAWLCRKPVVGSRTTYGSSIKASHGGYVARNAKDWITPLDKLVSSGPLRMAMGEAGEGYVKENRTYDMNVGLWHDAYTSLLGGKSNG